MQHCWGSSLGHDTVWHALLCGMPFEWAWGQFVQGGNSRGTLFFSSLNLQCHL